MRVVKANHRAQRIETMAAGSSGLNSLLVATDLTAVSDRVFDRVPRLPLAANAKVTVLHVIPESLPRRERVRAEAQAIRELSEEVRIARRNFPSGVTINPVVKVGAPARTISATATKAGAELVVMGRGGGRPLRDELLGATSERVTRHSRLPVLIVRLPARAPWSRPALAIDIDKAACRAVEVLLRVLALPRPPVLVIHAVDNPYSSYVFPSRSGDESRKRLEELQRQAEGEISALLRKAVARASVPPEEAPAWTTHIRCGAPRDVVIRAARKNRTDLLVLGTRGFPGTPLFLGTVSGDVLRRSRCDVLVVPPPRTSQ